MADDEFSITTDKGRMDIAAIHAFLETSYWAAGIPRDVVERSIKGSDCFGVFRGSEQVGFARVITDGATFAYLADVYILEQHRGKGLAKRLMNAVMAHPPIAGVRRFMLVTRDAGALYEQYGFMSPPERNGIMQIVNRDIYRNPPGAR